MNESTVKLIVLGVIWWALFMYWIGALLGTAKRADDIMEAQIKGLLERKERWHDQAH